jgi:hypothetical protein
MVLSSDTGAVLRQRNLSAELANVMEMNGEMAGVRADGTLLLLVSGFSYTVCVFDEDLNFVRHIKSPTYGFNGVKIPSSR